jgi:Fic family protein
MRSFLERLMFQISTYTENYNGLLTKNIPVGFMYSMNVPKEYMEQVNYRKYLKTAESHYNSEQRMKILLFNIFQKEGYFIFDQIAERIKINRATIVRDFKKV